MTAPQEISCCYCGEPATSVVEGPDGEIVQGVCGVCDDGDPIEDVEEWTPEDGQ